MRAPNHSLRKARWAVALMFAMNGFVMGSWAPQIPLLLPRHQIGEFTLGLLILGLGAGAVVAMAVSGGLIARHGSARIVAIFAPLAGLTLAPVVLAPTLWLLAPAMALMGALIGCMDVAMNANAVEVERRMGRAIMSSSHGFWSLGGFVGGSAGGWIIAEVGAENHALLVSILSLLLALAASRWLIGDPPTQLSHSSTAPSRWPRHPAIYIIGAMALFAMIPEGAVLDWAALYLAQELGAGLSRSGLGFAFFAAAMAIMRFAGDAVRNRFGAVQTLRWSGVIAAGGMMAASLASNDLTAIAAFAIAGLGIANLMPITLSAAGNEPGLGAGVGISIVTMLGYSGILIAPSTIGFVADHIGFRPTYAGISLLLLVIALLGKPRIPCGSPGAPSGQQSRHLIRRYHTRKIHPQQ